MNLQDINGTKFYHGSTTKFSQFSYDWIGGDKGNDQEGPGFYLTTNYEDAAKYAGPRGGIAEVIAKIRHVVPLKGNPKKSLLHDLILAAPDLDDTLTNWGDVRDKALRTAINSILEYNNGPHDAYQQVWIDFYHRRGHSGDIEYLKNMVLGSYDGVLIPRNELYHFIAFDPMKLTILSWT